MAYAHVAAKAVGLEYAGLVVVMACDEIRSEVRRKVEVGVAKPIHPHDKPDVFYVRLDQPDICPQADKKHDRQHQEREDAKAPGRSRFPAPPGRATPRWPREP